MEEDVGTDSDNENGKFEVNKKQVAEVSEAKYRQLSASHSCLDTRQAAVGWITADRAGVQ